MWITPPRHAQVSAKHRDVFLSLRFATQSSRIVRLLFRLQERPAAAGVG
jgi:hypothetical protein